MIFLSETKIPTSKARKFLESMGFYNLDFMDPKGKKRQIDCWLEIGSGYGIVVKKQELNK